VVMPKFVEIGQTASEIWRFFDFPRWRPPPSWIFKISNFQRLAASGGSKCVALPNFVEIGRTVAEIWRFFIFPRWQPSAILDLLCGCLDHPRRVLGGLYHCAKFGLNRCSSFDNMQVLVFCDFGLKTPIHAPFLGGIVGHISPKKVTHRPNPKKDHPWAEPRHLSHKA